MNKTQYWISVLLLVGGLLGLTIAARATSFSKEVPLADCPVTQPPDPAFVPPDSFPAQPPGTHFWYGSDDLWTALPADLTWEGLPRDAHGYGNKLPYWSVHFDLNKKEYPELSVRATPLDGPAPPYETDWATNGFNPESGLFMLTGLNLATTGCWEVSASYRDARLDFVIRVAP